MKKDKARDIARGVLPSTARKGARDNKRNFHKSHRGAQRQALHRVERAIATVDDDGHLYSDLELYDDFEERDVIDGYAASTKKEGVGWDDLSQNGEIIYSRRGADKLGPLISWATAIEKRDMVGWDDADKIAYFKAVLPDNLQGRHALGHVKQSLRLEDDEFRTFYYNLSPPLTRNDIHDGLVKIFSTSKGRSVFREFLYETVPVAAHHTTANNKVKETAPAVDENGAPRYVTEDRYVNGRFRPVTYQPTCDVYVPQIVSTSCDDCTFLRNDPLATSAAFSRFVDILWDARSRFTRYYRLRISANGPEHDYIREITAYVTYTYPPR